jgi:hypothetical protein
MAGFLGPLRVEELPDGRRWKLLEPCVYHLKAPDGVEWVEAPLGLVTDFGSIPRPLWAVPGLSPFGRWQKAYVIHDKLFLAPVIRIGRFAVRSCSFSEANDILCEGMHVLGANWFLRQVVWAAVQTAGRIAWNRQRRRQYSSTTYINDPSREP